MSDNQQRRPDLLDEARAELRAEAMTPSTARDIDLDKRGIDREEAHGRHQAPLSVHRRGGR